MSATMISRSSMLSGAGGGAIGQPDAGTLSAGSYTLNGGFWVDLLGNRLILPLIPK